jgi:hypothetical protein
MHVSHIRQKLHEPNRFFHAMASGHIFRLHRRRCNDWLFLAFPRNDSNANEKHVPYGGSLIVYIFHPIRIAKSFQGNSLPFEVYFEVQSVLQCDEPTFNMNWLIHYKKTSPM